jgi:putative salt-induced outer membrane protein YdiY
MLSRIFTTGLSVVCTLLMIVGRASADPVLLTIGETNTKPALPDLSWVPPEDTFDWVQLKSGEWLKGRAKAMQDDELEFDSEEMDERTFDWQDIRQIRTGKDRVIQIKFINGELLTGGIAITPTEVVVTGTESRVVPRDQLQSFTRGGAKERNYWSGKVDLGLTIRSGNTEQTDYNGQASFQRRTPTTRVKLDYIGNVSEAAKVESANSQRVNAEFDVWLSRYFYLVVPSAEYFSDPFQNIGDRVTVGVGVGYDIVNRKKVEWNVTLSPAYQETRFASYQLGEPESEHSAALAVTSYFNWEISDPIEWTLEYRGQITGKAIGETTHHAVSTVAVDITKRIDVDFSFVWDRITNPKVGADGVRPEPDDYRFVVSLAFDF